MEEATEQIIVKQRDSLSALAMFPALFTAFCGFVFAVPIWSTLRIEQTPAVSYFSSGSSYLVLAIPAIIVAVHLGHLWSKAPTRVGVFMGLVLPSLVLLFVSNAQYVLAVDKTDKLYSSDCDTFHEKRDLQRSWEAAYKLYTSCLQTTSEVRGFSVDTLKQHFRIQDCDEYAAALANRELATADRVRDWEYLKQLEEEHLCAGWCYHGEQLWASSANKDSCSVVVSHVFETYVKPHSWQVSSMMLTVLATSAVLMIVLGPTLRRLGIDW